MTHPRWIDRFGAALLCAVSVLLCAAGAASAASLEDARNLLRKGDADAAGREVTEYLQAHPGDREGRFLLANILAGKGQLEAAYAIFDKLVAEVPDDPVSAAVRDTFENRGASADAARRLATLFRTGQEASQKRQWDEAIKALTEAVGLVPGNVAARVNLAQVLAEVRRWDEAIPHLEEALQRRPGDPDILRRLANVYERAGRQEDALGAYEQLFKRGAKDPDLLFAYARLLLSVRQDFAEAIQVLNRALAADPTNTQTLYLLGVARAGQGDTKGAFDAYNRAVAADPTNYRAYFELGKLYEAEGRDAESLKAFEAVVRYGGGSPEAEQAGRRLSLFSTSPEVARQVREGLNRGVAAIDAGDLESAEKILQGVLDLVPGNPLALYNLATAYTREGRNDAAIEALKKALESDPRHFLSYYGLALIYQGAGRFEEAYEAYKQVVRWAPPDNPVAVVSRNRVQAVEALLKTFAAKQDARNAFLKGNQLAGQGDLEGALAQYEKAIGLDDQNAFYHYNAGIVYFELKNYAEAFKAFKEAVRLKPDHVQSHFRLGLFYSASGFASRALDEFRAVIKYGTDEPEVAEAKRRIESVLAEADRKQKGIAYLVVVDALAARGDRDGAIRAVERGTALMPDNREMVGRHIELLLAAKRWEDARPLVEAVLKEHPDAAQFVYYLSQIEKAAGNEDAAIENLRKAAAAFPDRISIHIDLAKGLEAQGKADEGIEVLRAALQKHPDEVKLILELGPMLRRADRLVEAAALYDWYLSTHDETAELLLERGLVAVALGAGAAQQERAPDTAIAAMVAGAEGGISAPKYATPAEWFERAIAAAGPGEGRIADAARRRLEQTKRLRLNLNQTVIDYNTNANNSATAPLTGVSSRLVFQAVYQALRTQYLVVPLTVTTDHRLHYSFQTYVNVNSASVGASLRVPHLTVSPDVTLQRVRTQRGTASETFAGGVSTSFDVSFPDTLQGSYRRTEFTSLTNATNNYLEERFDAVAAEAVTLGTATQLSARLNYLRRLRNAVAVTLDTDRTDVTASLQMRRNFAGQRSVSTSVFGTDSQDVRTANIRPSNGKIAPILSRTLGASAAYQFRLYPRVTTNVSGSYSVTDFREGLFQAFPDPGGGPLPIIVETAQRNTSFSYGVQLVYRPDDKATWVLDLRQVEAKASVDVPADVQDILTDQVVQDNINNRQTVTLSMRYAF